MRTILFLVALVAAPAFAQGSIFPSKTTKRLARQLEPGNVSEEVKAFLKASMKDHAKEMKDLSVAVAIVNFADTQRLAQAIANQPRLDPSIGPAAKLPPRYFELQALQKKTAQDLSDVAKGNDMSATLERYSELVEHCMACHAAFKTQVGGTK